MRVTIKHNGVVTTITSPAEHINDVIEQLIIPALLGAGFMREGIIDGMEDAVTEWRDYQGDQAERANE